MDVRRLCVTRVKARHNLVLVRVVRSPHQVSVDNLAGALLHHLQIAAEYSVA